MFLWSNFIKNENHQKILILGSVFFNSMEKERLLYTSIFTLFLGFIMFMASILNNRFTYSQFISAYFVLFIIAGMIMAGTGMIMMLVWHVKNKKPYLEVVRKDHFPSYFGFGIFLLVIGITIISYYSKMQRGVYYMAMSITVAGIILLIIGLKYFAKEVLFIDMVKKENHSI